MFSRICCDLVTTVSPEYDVIMESYLGAWPSVSPAAKQNCALTSKSLKNLDVRLPMFSRVCCDLVTSVSPEYDVIMESYLGTWPSLSPAEAELRLDLRITEGHACAIADFQRSGHAARPSTQLTLPLFQCYPESECQSSAHSVCTR